MNIQSEIALVPNWINGKEIKPTENHWLEKFNPDSGKLLSYFSNSSANDVQEAIAVADQSLSSWMLTPPVKRGEMLFNLVAIMKEHFSELADCIALETGKPPEDASGEVRAAILQAEFFAGEGMRLYGRSLSSVVPGKQSFTVRQARGVAGLIVPANTPIANIAWKTFPALVCGNTVVLKAAEDSPRIAHFFATLTKKAGLPDGIFNVIQGSGLIAGGELVKNEKVAVISFTGSTAVGRWIGEVAGKRLARVSLELGGKNPFVVCDDANLEQAVHWAALSAFSNAGQRCAAGSRILVFESVYKEFKKQFVAKAQSLKLGVGSGCDLGPVINKRQQQNILNVINKAKVDGGNILCGGLPPSDTHLANGYYVLPTIIEGLSHLTEVGCKELFGPVALLHPVADIESALQIANSSEYGLTSAIHTANVDRAMWFAQRVKSGVANVNLGTFGSEPHMPFGGFGASGNGTREPGIEALDVYSELKNISFFTRNELI
jgi:acyl-CoA reductase-like NAD-dependent aldehyde dehydrogenase